MNTNTFIMGRGFLYWLDARAKLLVTVLLAVLVFFPTHYLALSLLFLIIFGISWHAVTFKQSLKPLRSLLFIIVVMALFIPLTQRGGEPLWSMKGRVLVTHEGAKHFAVLTLRLLIITYSCTLYVWTTEMAEINLALRWYGLTYKGALTVTLAFRFIPFIGETFVMIRDSHSLRSASESSQKERLRIGDLVPTVTSALVFALKAIPHLATTLEHRGFGSSRPRSSYKRLEAKGGLFIHFLVSVIILTATFVLLRTI